MNQQAQNSITTHNLGYPRMGVQRELKFALERYWRGEETLEQLESTSQLLRSRHWQDQKPLTLQPVGDFSWYDHVLDTSFLLGNLPTRFNKHRDLPPQDQYFIQARGKSVQGDNNHASDMTKWFDTNYHYIVPELYPDTTFQLQPQRLLSQIAEAKSLGHQPKPVVLGPLSYLWLSTAYDVNKLDFLDSLITEYGQLFEHLGEHCEWVQIDEPILSLDLPQEWRSAFESSYHKLQKRPVKLLLTNYFGPLGNNLNLVTHLPVDGIHIDAVRGKDEVAKVIDQISNYKVLSLGVIDGRNIWRSNILSLKNWLAPIYGKLGNRLWLAPSCSLLHVPVDLQPESQSDTGFKFWLAFAKQKVEELELLKELLEGHLTEDHPSIAVNYQANLQRQQANEQKNTTLAETLEKLTSDHVTRTSKFEIRKVIQQKEFQLPLFPTTTIGSFPQTQEIRHLRRQFKLGELSEPEYELLIKSQIKDCVQQQESLGLDVLVHGEAERNDMVEYFGEQLSGYGFTDQGWVQSYGSRCVKPPVIFADVVWQQPMTVAWSQYAQSQTQKPVKGMLTGPITMLQWAFVRDDQPRQTTALQIAWAIRQEVVALESAGIGIIQVDEPALREGLPLRKGDWPQYLKWAVQAFKLATSGVSDVTQVHTHMCYSEFNDIISAIAELDADVITIETSRSNMEILNAFQHFNYPNDIGPGVYDIHSPRIPQEKDMKNLLDKALLSIPKEQLWVNPDCGLKTRSWDEVLPALDRMVKVAKALRAEVQQNQTETV